MTETTPARADGPRWLWPALTAVGILAAAGFLVARDPHWFFYGDTQAAYFGWWYHLGSELRAGRWPLLDLHAWSSGNHVAEGQWGLFSPLNMAIGLLATVVPSVLVMVTGVKLALLVTGGLGVFAVARSYGVRAPLACVAGTAAPMGGMTQYLDSPSWVAGLMIWSLFPWVWWALRRVIVRHANPLPALVLGYLLVTVGYVYGTIMLVVLIGACLLEAWAARDRRATLHVLGVGVVCGLVALAVYLPGVLTAPVTLRSGNVTYGHNDPGKFTTDLLAMFTSGLPTASVPGTTTHVLPYAFLVWFLPLLVWVDLGRLRRAWRPIAGLLALAVLTLLLVNGPSHLGPLRWPLRLQPFMTLVWAVALVVVLARCRVRRPSRARAALAGAWVVVAVAVAVVRAPGLLTGHLFSGLVVAAGIALVWVGLRRRWPVARLGAAAVAVTLACFSLQHLVFPDPPSPDHHMPLALSDYRKPLHGARGDVMLLGHVDDTVTAHREAASELLVGSAWYLNGHQVQSTYTAAGHRAYVNRFCVKHEGSTCTSAMDTLFAVQPDTGVRRVDLLGVSTLVLVRHDLAAAIAVGPPAGWRVAAEGRWTVTWVRTHPVPGAGHPVWASPGTQVSAAGSGQREVRFRVGAVPPGGGRVVLSALAWPGFHTDVGRMAPPIEGYLATVDLPASAAGKTVTVRYDPPGWQLERAAWVLALLLGLAWSLLERRRRRNRGERAAAGARGATDMAPNAALPDPRRWVRELSDLLGRSFGRADRI